MNIQELLHKITELVKGKRTAITTHKNADPDGIGSVFAMQYLLKKLGAEEVTVYISGFISHYQNKTLVNTLNLVFKEATTFPDDVECLVIVDVAETGTEHLPEINRVPNIVVDHHKKIPEQKAQLCIIEQVGSTCTIIAQLLLTDKLTDSDEDQLVATALYFGIMNDTKFLSRGATDLDRDVYRELSKHIDADKLETILNYPIPPYMFDLETIANEKKEVKDSTMVIGLGYLSPQKRDAIPHVADKFLRMDSISTVFVFAVIQGKIVASVRSSSSSVELNSLCKSVIGDQSGAKIGEGGGVVNLGFFADASGKKEVDNKLWEVIKYKITHNVFDFMSG